MKNIIKRNGFTLVELLVVISIIAILTIVSVSSYKTAQIKARDAERKANLDSVSKSLMLYYTDNGKFPKEDVFKLGTSNKGLTGPDGTVYMVKTPLDPTNDGSYKFVYKTDEKFFNLFANLENKEDSQCNGKYTITGFIDTFCYGISSPNSIVTSWDK